MIFNVTRTDKEVTRAINELVGKPFGLIDNLKKRGIGSEPFTILEVNPQLSEYTGVITDLSKCNMELRPGGIIIHFNRERVLFSWPIPYRHLTIFQNGEATTFYQHTDFIKLTPKFSKKGGRSFVQKILNEKSAYAAASQLPL